MLKVEAFEQKKTYPNYVPTKDEKTKIDYVSRRFKDMKNSRTIVDKDWETYQTMIDAVFTPYPDGRSSSTVPLSTAMLELYVAEALKIPTDYQFRSETSETATNAKALEYVWKYDWRTKKRKKVMTEEEYICGGFGTSIKYTGFESTIITQHDYDISEDLKPIWNKKEIKDESIIVANVDIRDFYIDNTAKNGIEDAGDCIWLDWISYDKFQELKWNIFYRNIEKVAPRNWSTEDKPFLVSEEDTKTGDYVRRIRYYSVDKDAYMELANGVLVREHPLNSTMNGRKALPFTIRVLWKKNYSIYGRGLCEGLMMFNSEVNNLRELLMDAIKRSNTQTLAIGNWLSFDWRTFSYDNEIITFDGNLANNFQQLSGNPPNQAIFNYMTQLYKDIAIYIGIDIQNIIWQPQQTAFQTEVQREASQKRINVWLTNRDLANERFADLYKDLLQRYFPRKNADWLYPTIEIEGEQMVNWKFRKKKWKSIFEVTPEIIRGDISIDVYTNTTAPTINAVDRQQKLDLLNAVWWIANGYAVAKQAGVDIETILPLKKTLRDLASDYNLEIESNADQEDVQDAKIKLQKEIMAKMGWMQMQQQVEQPLQPKQQWQSILPQ